MCKVVDIASHNRQFVDDGRCRDHGILVDRIGLPVHQSSPDAERRGVHWQDVVCGCGQVGPPVDLGGLAGILLAQ